MIERVDSLHSLYEETTQKYRSSGETSYLLQMIRIKKPSCVLIQN